MALKRQFRRAPDSASYAAAQACILDGLDRHAEADRTLAHACDLDADDFLVDICLGDRSATAWAPEKAAAYYSRALARARSPLQRSFARDRLATLALWRGDVTRAIDGYREALKLDTTSRIRSSLLQGYALALECQGEDAAVVDVLRQGMKAAPVRGGGATLQLAEFFLTRGRYAELDALCHDVYGPTTASIMWPTARDGWTVRLFLRSLQATRDPRLRELAPAFYSSCHWWPFDMAVAWKRLYGGTSRPASGPLEPSTAAPHAVTAEYKAAMMSVDFSDEMRSTTWLRNALKRAPDSDVVKLFEAHYLAARGDIMQTRRIVADLRARPGPGPLTDGVNGDVLLREGRLDDAAAAYARYLSGARGTPQEADAAYWLATAMLWRGDADAADKILKSTRSGDARVAYMLAAIRLIHGDAAAAKGIALDQTTSMSYRCRANILMALGQWQTVVDMMRQHRGVRLGMIELRALLHVRDVTTDTILSCATSSWRLVGPGPEHVVAWRYVYRHEPIPEQAVWNTW